MRRWLPFAVACACTPLGCSSIAGLDDLELRGSETPAGGGGGGNPGPSRGGSDAGHAGTGGASGSSGTPGGAGTPSIMHGDGGTPADGAMPMECQAGWMWSESVGECIDPCDVAVCDEHAQCTVISGSARCDCVAPYVGEGTSCTFDASCALLDCDDHAECVITGPDQRRCQCLEGYEGSGETCENPDDCAGAPCEGRGTCSDRVGGYHCECFDGFSGPACATDVCAPNPCVANIPCTRTADGYECVPQCADQPGEKCAKGELCARDDDCATGECEPESHTCWDSRCISPAGLETVLLGDSYVNSGAVGGLRIPLQQLATTQGTALQGFRDYAVAGARFLDVAVQYQNAKAAAPGETVVILTGGLSNILFYCDAAAPGDSECTQVVDGMVDDLEGLLTLMAGDGVDHVIYFFYPRIASSIANATIDYAYPHVAAACARQPNCHFIDLRPIFNGHPDWIHSDGINLTASGFDAIAQAVWDVMKAECIYQR